MAVLLLLLPPSEGKDAGGGRGRWSPESGVFGDALGSIRSEIVKALDAAGGGDEALLGVRGTHLERAKAENLGLVAGPRSLPAWRRYTGVVHGHLDPASLAPAARRRVVVVSGLLGAVRYDDPVPAYRLKMGARLDPLGRLSARWREPLTEAIAEAAGRAMVVDLLTNEHRSAIEPSRFRRYVRIDLREREGGAAGGHDAKAAKGLLARAVLEAGSLDAVATFVHDRFTAEIVG